jgi:GH15 family glucan-1,4-alpha-glucosidase
VRQGLSTQAGYGGEVVVSLMRHLEEVWDQPDDGIWEVRGPRRQFTHSKVMAWVAFDRAVRIAETVGVTSASADAVQRWRDLRDKVHAEACEKGWNDDVGSFTQYYGSSNLDASLLMMGPVGFLPMDDPRLVATVEAIQQHLTTDGFVSRYQTDDSDGAASSTSVDGLKGKEGSFLLTTFWLADNLALMGRRDEAREIFERLLSLRNDVGLLSEEYDPDGQRLLGNFPQAFSHIGLIHTAANLSFGDRAPGAQRAASS